jgi:hypothetical protein
MRMKLLCLAIWMFPLARPEWAQLAPQPALSAAELVPRILGTRDGSESTPKCSHTIENKQALSRKRAQCEQCGMSPPFAGN